MPDQYAVEMALKWVRPGEVSGLAIVMYCRPDGASNEEVLAACRDKKINRARALHLKRKLDFMKARMNDGTLPYFIGPVGTRPGPAGAEPFVVRPQDYQQRRKVLRPLWRSRLAFVPTMSGSRLNRPFPVE